MPLTYFTAIYDLKAVIARSSLDEDPDPFTQAVSGLVWFHPTTTAKVRTNGGELIVPSEEDERTYIIRPQRARIDNGVLKNVRGTPLDTTVTEELPGAPADHRRYGFRLVANTIALGPLSTLDYRVTFSKVVFDKGDRKLAPFQFPAPDEDTVVDLSLVHHRTNAR